MLTKTAIYSQNQFCNFLFPFLLLIVFFVPSQLFAQAKTVTGNVTGSDGAPIAGVSVQVKGGSAGTATDASGNFSLNVDDPMQQ